MLNVRQEKFCLEYVKCGNATEAAISAGYAEKYAGQNADKLLKNTKIQSRLQEIREQVESEKIADITEMQQKLTEIIRQQAVEEIPMVVNHGDFSEIKVVKKKPSIKNVVDAVNSLGKMQGAFKEKIDLNTNQVILVDDVPEDW